MQSGGSRRSARITRDTPGRPDDWRRNSSTRTSSSPSCCPPSGSAEPRPLVTLVVVAGALANKPGNGGAAWTRLSYVLGLRRLGFDAFFIEQIAPDDCVDESG